MITIQLNGKPHQVMKKTTVKTLVEQLNLIKFAVEINAVICPSSTYSTTYLAEGDKVEIIIAVGGG